MVREPHQRRLGGRGRKCLILDDQSHVFEYIFAVFVMAGTAAVLWDSFEPKACDIHSAVYSKVLESALCPLFSG